MVVVALGDPGTPDVPWASAGATGERRARRLTADTSIALALVRGCM
jgi:hypothetical protein